jgi:hypothetical protein
MHGNGTHTISCTFLLAHSFEKNLLCMVIQVELFYFKGVSRLL